MGKAKIIYEDIAVGAKADCAATATKKQPFISNSKIIAEGNISPSWALCLPKYSKLDGSYSNAPYTLSDTVGYMSTIVSDCNGDISASNQPVIILTLGGNYTSTGISLKFNTFSEDYCSSVNIKWYQGETLKADDDFSPDKAQYFCEKSVSLYNKVILTFKRTSKPFRYVWVSDIQFGAVREFGSDEVKQIRCLQEISQISEQLSINTLNFTLSAEKVVDYMFQKNQPVSLYFNENILGRFFIKSTQKKASSIYNISAEDCIGAMSGTTFYGGMYTNLNAETLINQIMAETGFTAEIESGLKTLKINGYLPKMCHREALAWIAFSIGAVIDTSNSDKVLVYALPVIPETTVITKSHQFTGLTIEKTDVVTEIKLTCHSFVAGTENVELFNGILSIGTHIIEFSAPAHTLSITGGTIIVSNANYAKITVTAVGTVILNGKKYNHSMAVITKTNPNISASEAKNVKKIDNVTLINDSNASAVADRVYNYYIKTDAVHTRLITNGFEIGNKYAIDADYEGYKSGVLERLDMAVNNEIIAQAVIR